MSVDSVVFRHAVSTFGTGVTVITTGRDGNYHAMTANAFMSLSLEPITVLVSIEKTANTYPIILAAGVFTVNILAEDQEEVSRTYASKAMQDRHTLKDAEFTIGRNGVPKLAGCLAYIECHTIKTYDGFDHTLFVGEVDSAEVARDVPPLMYFRSAYRRLAP
ncbi:MAG TPA: flavin reductase family protein [Dehalococcoidia bacterium]|nr:flavin reductase family protein [Dehalococcoidia bacterium]